MDEDRSVLTRAASPPDEVRRHGELPEHVVDWWFSDGAGGRPLIVLVHGGFWRPAYDRRHLRPMADGLRSAGWDVAAIEYRREPGRPDVTVGDVAAALSSFDRPIITVGHSAGGHLVLWAAVATPPADLVATIALAPVADLVLAHRLGLGDGAVEAYLGGAPTTRSDLDPARLPPPATPVTIVHGTADEIVPLSVAESYAGRHPSTRLVPVEAAGHFALVDPQTEAYQVVVGELTTESRSANGRSPGSRTPTP